MLNITLDINGHVLHTYHVQRLKPLGSPPLDARCTYKVTNNFGKVMGRITRHRFGDGADRLAQKVLRKFGREVM